MPQGLSADLRFAARRLGRQPLSSLAIVVSLSFALGLNSAVFSFVDGVLLRPFPYPDSEQLYVVWGADDLQTRRGISGRRVEQWQQIAGIDGVSPFSFTPLRIAIGSEDARIELQIGLIGADTFSVLGIPPLLGRTIDRRDADAQANKVVVISHALWVSAFGGDGSALGRPVVIDGQPHDIVGVMPESFFFPDYVFDAWIPLRRDSDLFGQVQELLRLRSDADARRVQAEMTAIRSEAEPVGSSGTLGMFPIRQLVVREHRRATWTLWAITATLLGMACIGASSWFVSRIVTRSRELATRVALGGDSGRLVREVVAEPCLVAGLAAILAIGWAHLALRMLAWIAPSLARVSTAKLDPWTIGYMGVIAIVVCVLSSLAPLLAARSVHPSTLLSDAWSTSRRTAVRWQRGFLGAQVASATAMCVTAVLLVQSFVTLNRLDLGFDPRGIVVASLNVPRDLRASAAAHEAAIAAVLEQLKALPAVQAATASYGVPLRWDRWDQTAVSTDDRLAWAGIWTVGDDYFATLRIPVLRGQEWTTQEEAASTRTVVVNGTFARAVWGTLDVIGRRFQTLKPTAALRERIRQDPSLVRDTRLMRDRSSYELDSEWTVVGVVADVRMFGLDDSTGPAIYMRSRDRNNTRSARQSLVIRTESGGTLHPAVIAQIVAQSADVEVVEIYRLDELARESIVGRGSTPLLTFIASLLGTIALVVAATGVFGIASTAASQRRRELSVRRALGAGSMQLLRALWRTELATICVGLLLGLGLGFLATQLVASTFVDAGGPPALAYIVTSLLIACVSVIGFAVPFRQALRAPIMDDLRT
jgi:putative ABC transport system permease protein